MDQSNQQAEKTTSIRRNEVSILDHIMGGDDDFGELLDSDGECDEDIQIQLKGANMDGGSYKDQTLKNLVQDISQVPIRCRRLPILKEIGSNLNIKTKEISHEGSNQSGFLKAGKIRYFVIKSLNHHNIEKSVEKGIWATQATNEPILNEAFKNSKKVLLIFSVNSSGNFQGYAQMISSIGPKKDSVWNEASWGGSFKVEWIKRHDLPFQKTTHLRNPLNCFKPVKISRDCQELTEDIGAALCALIDKGAHKETRPKRYIKHNRLAETPLSKEYYAERNYQTDDRRSTRIPAASINSHLRSLPYHFGLPNGHYQVKWPMVMAAHSGYTLFPTAHHNSSMPEIQCGRKRGRSSNKPEETEKLLFTDQRGGISKHPGTYFIQQDDDFLNMTYEEYLRRLNNRRGYDLYQGTGMKNKL